MVDLHALTPEELAEKVRGNMGGDWRFPVWQENAAALAELVRRLEAAESARINACRLGCAEEPRMSDHPTPPGSPISEKRLAIGASILAGQQRVKVAKIRRDTTRAEYERAAEALEEAWDFLRDAYDARDAAWSLPATLQEETP